MQLKSKVTMQSNQWPASDREISPEQRDDQRIIAASGGPLLPVGRDSYGAYPSLAYSVPPSLTDGQTGSAWEDSTSIWSNQRNPHGSRGTDGSPSMPSGYGSIGQPLDRLQQQQNHHHHRRRPHPQSNDDVLSQQMSDLSFRDPRVSSLAMAASRGTASMAYSLGGQSTGNSIPGLAPTFSGSTSQSIFSHATTTSATMVPGPPPGFLSPIQSTKSLRDEESSSMGSKEGKKGRRRRRNKRGGGQGGGGAGTKGHRRHNSKGGSSASLGSSLGSMRGLMDLPTETDMLSLAKTPKMSGSVASASMDQPILPQQPSIASLNLGDLENDDEEGEDDSYSDGGPASRDPALKKREWLLRMNRKLNETPIGDLDPSSTPVSAIMNAWAKTKSSHGASMVEMWLKRAEQEYEAGNSKVVPTTKMYTIAGKPETVIVGFDIHASQSFLYLVDAWAKSGEGGAAAKRAEAILQHMNMLFQSGANPSLRVTTGIFNAVINAWARSREKVAPQRAEQILQWMEQLHKNGNLDVQPDKYTFNTGENVS